MNRGARFLLIAFSTVLISAPAIAQTYSAESFAAMKWRLVGPHRAGRVTCVAGIPGQPAIYYFGTPGGGVWNRKCDVVRCAEERSRALAKDKRGNDSSLECSAEAKQNYAIGRCDSG